MEENFEVVVHHMGVFKEFLHTGYEGLEITWLCDPERWSYFEVLGNLEVMGYTEIDSMWFYDPYLAPGMHCLYDDNGSNRVRFIAQNDGRAHIYVVHCISQPEIIENLSIIWLMLNWRVRMMKDLMWNVKMLGPLVLKE